MTGEPKALPEVERRSCTVLCSSRIDPAGEHEHDWPAPPRFSDPPEQQFCLTDARSLAREPRQRGGPGWLDAIPIPAALVTPTGEIAAVSPALTELVQTAHPMIGAAFADLLWPESRASALALIINPARRQQAEVTLTATGNRYAMQVGMPLGDNRSGMRVAVLVSLSAPDDDPQAEAPREQHSRGSIPAPATNPETPLRALCGLPLPALVTVDGKVAVVTQRAASLLGLPAESLEDLLLEDLVGSAAAQEILEQCQVESAQWQPQALAAHPVRIGGSIRACACCYIPFGRPGVGLLLLESWGGTGIDIPTEHTRQSSAGYLIAGVAHEINNPLAFIIPAMGELRSELERRRPNLQGHPIDAWIAQIEEVQEGVARIASVVQNLRAAREATPDAEPTLINQVIVNTLRLAAASVPQTISIRRDLGLVLPAQGNRQRLGQVLLNLVLNAAQALTGAGRETGNIFVRSWSDSRYTWLEVRDDGPGVLPEHREKIFEPFFTTRATGSGLGLAVCRAMIRELGGELSLENVATPGACFRVRLPVWRAGRDQEVGAANIVSSQPPKPTKRRVLLVDDDPPVRRALRRMLAAYHQVSEAGSLQEALALAEQAKFDVLVTDLVMSHGGGPALIERLKQTGSPLANHVVVISGMAPDATPTDYPRITKPCKAEELLLAIDRVAQ